MKGWMLYRVEWRRHQPWVGRANCACEMRVSDFKFSPCFPHFGTGMRASVRYLERAARDYEKRNRRAK